VTQLNSLELVPTTRNSLLAPFLLLLDLLFLTVLSSLKEHHLVLTVESSVRSQHHLKSLVLLQKLRRVPRKQKNAPHVVSVTEVPVSVNVSQVTLAKLVILKPI